MTQIKRYKSLFDEKYRTKYENDGKGGTKPVRIDDSEEKKDEACDDTPKKDGSGKGVGNGGDRKGKKESTQRYNSLFEN